MRNQLYFDLNLHVNPKVLLTQYEDTVLNKEQAFRRIFDFLGFPFESRVIDGVFATSVGKHSLPEIDPAVQEICAGLKARLDAYYTKTSGWTPEHQAQLSTDET